jgi:hypothetical protein
MTSKIVGSVCSSSVGSSSVGSIGRTCVTSPALTLSQDLSSSRMSLSRLSLSRMSLSRLSLSEWEDFHRRRALVQESLVQAPLVQSSLNQASQLLAQIKGLLQSPQSFAATLVLLGSVQMMHSAQVPKPTSRPTVGGSSSSLVRTPPATAALTPPAGQMNLGLSIAQSAILASPQGYIPPNYGGPKRTGGAGTR